MHKSAKTYFSGWVAWREHWRKANIATSWCPQDSSRSKSSRREFTELRTRASFSPKRSRCGCACAASRWKIHERLRAGDEIKVREDDRSLLRSVVLQLKAEIRTFRLEHDGDANALQRSIPVHGKFGSFHHGRSNSKRKGQTSFYSLQRGKPSFGGGAS